MAEKILVKKLEPTLWQWREVNAQGQWRNNSFYTGDINLLKETIEGKSVWYLLNGAEVVTQKVTADIKDRKQLLKILPFEVEEDVIDPIEDMHFAFGPVVDGEITIAYGDFEWMADEIAEIESTGAEVQRCLVDYLMLTRPEQGWTLLLEKNWLMARTDTGLGFAVEQDVAPLYLSALATNAQPAALQLMAEDEQALTQLREMLPDTLRDNEDLHIEEGEAGYWDLVDPATVPQLEFRSGKLARKLPFDKWWSDWKYPLIASAAAFVLAVGATLLGQYQAEQERRQIMAKTDAIFKQVQPNGSITDPERQLRAMLGGGGDTGAPSNVVNLISGVAPAIKSMDDVVIRNFRYSLENGQLQMNIEAGSFTTFENLRSKIAEAGFDVEIKSANVYGDTHQAQMRVSEAG